MLRRLTILLGVLSLLGLVVLLVQSLPDIKRYLKIRKMVLRMSPQARGTAWRKE